MTLHKNTNWIGIEQQYRAGVRSLRDIGAEFGITEGAIRKKARKEDWVRDLSEKIKFKAQELVRKTEVRNTVRKETQQGIIDSVAQQQAAVLLNERTDIKRLSALCEKFENELEKYDEDLEKKAKVLKSIIDTRKTLIELRRRNYNISDNSNGDADTQQDSFAAWVKGSGGRVIGVVDAMESRLPAKP